MGNPVMTSWWRHILQKVHLRPRGSSPIVGVFLGSCLFCNMINWVVQYGCVLNWPIRMNYTPTPTQRLLGVKLLIRSKTLDYLQLLTRGILLMPRDIRITGLYSVRSMVQKFGPVKNVLVRFWFLVRSGHPCLCLTICPPVSSTQDRFVFDWSL